ncbi:hypothetical protein PsYK624_001420 [Phanerochaete sordida]|uniref:Uncharacterized protein n=1 Tax=Phanerochaete sordida TaxID=48140 RepID=A0A9P3FVX0_9APHY|nr:hypothetical protein PsYK624_001420 [Phanerochaete sordida]
MLPGKTRQRGSRLVVVTDPALRALWQGVPGFGILLESCGLLVQMVTAVLCSIFLAAVIGLRNPSSHPACPTCARSTTPAADPGLNFPVKQLCMLRNEATADTRDRAER